MSGVMIDQHFAQRGRLGRLLTAVAQHPGYLGIGIDENTAIVVRDDRFQVLGDGAVTIIDASEMSFTNLRALEQERHLALLGVKLHSLPAGYGFDLAQRRPLVPEGEGSQPDTDEEPERQ
jgi:cyanophycinase